MIYKMRIAHVCDGNRNSKIIQRRTWCRRRRIAIPNRGGGRPWSSGWFGRERTVGIRYEPTIYLANNNMSMNCIFGLTDSSYTHGSKVEKLGAMVGSRVGLSVGIESGLRVGRLVGRFVGRSDGILLLLGFFVGLFDGFLDGLSDKEFMEQTQNIW